MINKEICKKCLYKYTSYVTPNSFSDWFDEYMRITWGLIPCHFKFLENTYAYRKCYSGEIDCYCVGVEKAPDNCPFLLEQLMETQHAK